MWKSSTLLFAFHHYKELNSFFFLIVYAKWWSILERVHLCFLNLCWSGMDHFVSVCLNFQATIVILVIQNWVTLLLPFSVSRSSCWGTILSECHACRFQVEVHIGMCFLHIKNFISLLLRGYAISRHPWNLLFPSWDHYSTYEPYGCLGGCKSWYVR